MSFDEASTAEPSGAPTDRRVTIARSIVALAACIAFATAVLLIVKTATNAAGCGGVGSCDETLSSKWSYWIEIPVSVPAAAAYASMLAALAFTGRKIPKPLAAIAWSLLVALALIVAFAGAWFTALQGFDVQAFCPYCMTVHVSGWIAAAAIVFAARVSEMLKTVAWGASAAVGTVVCIVLVVGQLQYEREVFVIDEAPSDASSPPIEIAANQTPDPSPETVAPRPERLIVFYKMSKPLDVYAHPLVGSPKARVVLVEMFDYTCPHCRTFFEQLEEVRNQYGEQLAIVAMPTPLNQACNKFAGASGSESGMHEFACVYARLATAVWMVKPEAFADYHAWLMHGKTPPSATDARDEAEKRVGKEALERALDDFALTERIGQYADAWGEQGHDSIPKLVAPRFSLNAKFSSADQLRRLLERKLPLESAAER